MELSTKSIGWHVASVGAGVVAGISYAASGQVDLYALYNEFQAWWAQTLKIIGMLTPLFAFMGAAYRTYGQKQVPTTAIAVQPIGNATKADITTDSAGKTIAKVVGCLVACILLLWSMDAHAQSRIQDIAKRNDVNALPSPSSISGGIPSPSDLWQKIIGASNADLAYAAAMAQAAGTNSSKVRLQCINALIEVNKQASGANLPKGPDGSPMPRPEPSLVTNIETMAEIADNLSPQGPLFTSCAGAASLFRMQVLQVISGIITGTLTAATLVP